MTDCPRCGFSQPKDQFCANCGINMDSYRPAPKPISQKFASNTYIIGSLIVVILASMIWYLQSLSSDSSNIAESTITRDEAFEIEREQELQQAEEERKQRRVQINQQKEDDEKQRLAAETAAKAQANLALLQKQKMLETKAKKTVAPSQLEMRFFEISHLELETLFSSGQISSETPTSRTVVFNNTKILNKILANCKNLGANKTWDLKPGITLTATYGNISDEIKAINYEINFEVVINRVSSDGLSYQFRGGLYFAKGEESPPSTPFPAENHNMPPEGAIVIVGFLPHNLMIDEASAELLQAPLKVMDSPEFKESNSEFLIVLTPK